MRLQGRIYLVLAKIAPSPYRRYFAKQLIYAGESVSADKWLGSTTAVGLLIALTVLLLPLTIYQEFDVRFVLLAGILFVFTHFFSYLIVYFKAEDRSKRVDEALPDMLQLVSSNLRAGMTPFQALRMSARKEFGPLKHEIELATTKALGTASFSDALLSISKTVRSETLERSMKLFNTALRSGGHLAQLLEELSTDIATTRSLQRELITNTKTYTMFIIFTIAVGTPLLLAIAIHFLSVVTDLQQQTGASTAGFGLSFLAGEISITTSFLNMVSITLMAITASLASMLLGVISDGKMQNGLRYAPFLLIGSFVVFFLSKKVVGSYLLGIT